MSPVGRTYNRGNSEGRTLASPEAALHTALHGERKKGQGPHPRRTELKVLRTRNHGGSRPCGVRSVSPGACGAPPWAST